MDEGFFSLDLVRGPAPEPLETRCGACGLYKHCRSPKMPVSGKGKRKILIIAEAPGKNEDKEGIQLVGNSGRELMEKLSEVGINMRKDCWLDNAIICRPSDKEGNNRKPTDKEIINCRPHLVKTIEEFQPEVIVPLGGVSVKSLLRGIWNDKVGGITRWAGWQIPDQKHNAWVCPTFHPSYLLREENEALDNLFLEHLEAIAEIDCRPWSKVPDYKSKVQVILDDQQVPDIIGYYIHNKKPVAFDYETNMLKPDSDKARIISCSISDGQHTISFPWYGRAIKAMKRFILSPYVGKIASNMKFEERWTIKEFGHGVTNWKFDTMLGAHWLDSRQGIVSIKFQAYVHFGFPVYDTHIEPYRRSKVKGGNEENRMRDLDLQELLIYGGLDSLLEYKVAQVQFPGGIAR